MDRYPSRRRGPHERRGQPRPRPQQGRGGTRQDAPYVPASRRYFIAAGVLGVILVMALGVFVITRGGELTLAEDGGGASSAVGRPAETGLAPSSYSSTPSTGAYAAIEQRARDARPLTIEEAFPKRAQTLAVPGTGLKPELRARRLDGDCAAAVWGSGVGDALRQGGCTQAVRGLYADTEEGYALTVAVFNLSAKRHADRLVAMFGDGGFVQPLRGEAPLDRIGQGFTIARGLAMGHYAVVSWAQRLDGRGDAQDETLLSLLIEGSKAPSALGRAAQASPPGAPSGS